MKHCIVFFVLIGWFTLSIQPAISSEQSIATSVELAKKETPENKEWPFSVLGTIIVAGIGLISGAVGSLIAPWISWGIEKKRKSIEYKQSLIKEVRVLLDKSEKLENILSSSLWGFIQSNLTEQEIHSVSSGRVIHGTDHDCLTEFHMRKQIISRMLSRLEDQWKL